MTNSERVAVATAFIAEIVRSGLDSVHAIQWDAATALNMGYLQTLRLVIVPQAWKVMLPPVFSFFHPVHQGHGACFPDRGDGANLFRQGPEQ
jgi:ABC-type amino acid transport system permease subunit